jgi:hypothetical protein
MARTPKLLTPDEQDEILARTLKAQEVDLYTHEVNKDRFEKMLAADITGPWRDRVQGLLDSTNERIVEVESILAALDQQSPSDERLLAAHERVKAADAAAVTKAG